MKNESVKNWFNAFGAVRQEFNNQIETLEDELRQVEADRRDLEGTYQSMLANLEPATALQDVEEGIEKLDRRIGQLKKQIQYTAKGKLQKLSELIPAVEKYRDEVKADKAEQFRIFQAEVNIKKLEMVEILEKMGQTARDIHEIHASTNSLRMEACQPEGRRDSFAELPAFHQNPAYEGFDKAFIKVLGLPDWAARAAWDGQFPKSLKGGK